MIEFAEAIAFLTSSGASAGGDATPFTSLALPGGWNCASEGEMPPEAGWFEVGVAPPEADAPPAVLEDELPEEDPPEVDVAAYEVALSAKKAASEMAAASSDFARRVGILFRPPAGL